MHDKTEDGPALNKCRARKVMCRLSGFEWRSPAPGNNPHSAGREQRGRINQRLYHHGQQEGGEAWRGERVAAMAGIGLEQGTVIPVMVMMSRSLVVTSMIGRSLKNGLNLMIRVNQTMQQWRGDIDKQREACEHRAHTSIVLPPNCVCHPKPQGLTMSISRMSRQGRLEDEKWADEGHTDGLSTFLTFCW